MNPDVRPPASLTRKRVLCIEDEHFIGELYARALKRAGFDIKLVIDGAEGLREAQSNQYDIILLDLMLPNMTGFDILRTLRDPAQTPNLRSKIIITTNLEQKEEHRDEIERQADGYIIKADVTPKEMANLLSKINTGQTSP